MYACDHEGWSDDLASSWSVHQPISTRNSPLRLL
jgi:hypothetical protein